MAVPTTPQITSPADGAVVSGTITVQWTASTLPDTLVVAGATHAHTADEPSLVPASSTLAVQDASHAHTAEAPSLVMADTLAVQDATHAHAAGTPTLVVASASTTDWGITTVGNSGFKSNWVRGMGGQSPNTSGMTLDSVSIYASGDGAGAVRVGVYAGGTLDNPVGASLVVDLGPQAIPVEPGWVTIPASGEAIPADTPLWIFTRADQNEDVTVYSTTNSANAGDFQSTRGRTEIGGTASGGAGSINAWPDPLDGSASFGSYWYSYYLTFSA